MGVESEADTETDELPADRSEDREELDLSGDERLEHVFPTDQDDGPQSE